MEKNWLIRTKNNHILGPVTKEKVIELVNNGSIKPEDEVCSGNGFWFFLKEKELVQRYLIQGHPQSFNPVSEATNVLTNPFMEDELEELDPEKKSGTGVFSLDELQFEISNSSTAEQEEDLELGEGTAEMENPGQEEVDLPPLNDLELELDSPPEITAEHTLKDINETITESNQDLTDEDITTIIEKPQDAASMPEEEQENLELEQDQDEQVSEEDKEEDDVIKSTLSPERREELDKKAEVLDEANKTSRGDILLFILAVVILALSLVTFIYKDQIIKKWVSKASFVFPQAYAQTEDTFIIKKKSSSVLNL